MDMNRIIAASLFEPIKKFDIVTTIICVVASIMVYINKFNRFIYYLLDLNNSFCHINTTAPTPFVKTISRRRLYIINPKLNFVLLPFFILHIYYIIFFVKFQIFLEKIFPQLQTKYDLPLDRCPTEQQQREGYLLLGVLLCEKPPRPIPVPTTYRIPLLYIDGAANHQCACVFNFHLGVSAPTP